MPKLSERLHRKFAFCFGIAVDQESGKFIPNNALGRPNFPELRMQGYADAWLGGYAETLVIFAPTHESKVIKEHLVELGVSAEAIREFDTPVHTHGNAEYMKRFQKKLGVSDSDIFIMTSAYHVFRAALFGQLVHGLGLPIIASEVFTAARKVGDEDTVALKEEFFKTFNNEEFIKLLIDEFIGGGDLIAGRYTLPDDSVFKSASGGLL